MQLTNEKIFLGKNKFHVRKYFFNRFFLTILDKKYKLNKFEIKKTLLN